MPLKKASFSFRSKRDRCLNSPRSVLRGMWAFSTIVLQESAVEIVCHAAVMHFIPRVADEDVNIVEAFRQTVFGTDMIREKGWPAKS